MFRTRWEKSGASGAAAEFFLGHVVDPLEYNKAMRDSGYALDQYQIAEPWLNIVSSDPTKVDAREVRRLRQEYESQRAEIDALKAKTDEVESRLMKWQKIRQRS